MNKRGFTIIELLIVLAIATIGLGAMLSFFINQNKTAIFQEQVTDAQQNGRIALNIITEDLRMAGFGVPSGIDIIVPADAGTSLPETTNGGANSSDTIAFNANLEGAAILLNEVSLSNNTPITIDVSSAYGFETTEANKVVDFISFEDKSVIASATVTNVDTANNRLTITPNATVNVKSGVYVGTRRKQITYRIDNNLNLDRVVTRFNLDGSVTNDTVPNIASNIEDLQFAYAYDSDDDGDIETDANGIIWAVDTNNDGNLDNRIKDDGSYQALASTIAYSQIRAIRISLIARTTTEDVRNRVFNRPRLDDRTAATTNDGFRRRIFTTTVYIRNMSL
jgi:type IV pilus assembly protein PilW